MLDIGGFKNEILQIRFFVKQISNNLYINISLVTLSLSVNWRLFNKSIQILTKHQSE